MSVISKEEIEKTLRNHKDDIWENVRCIDGCYFSKDTKTKEQKWSPQSQKLTLYTSQLIQTLDMFHKYSKKENMLYSLHAGSLAGFYWNGKVMPFDDDIDIITSNDSFQKIKKFFWEDASPRSDYQIKKSYTSRKNSRVKKVDGVLYEIFLIDHSHFEGKISVEFKKKNPKTLLKIIPIDAVERPEMGGLDITVCEIENGKKIDRWSFNHKYNCCVGPIPTDNSVDFPEVDFSGIKTRAVVERLGADMLTGMYGKEWIIPCSLELKKYFSI